MRFMVALGTILMTLSLVHIFTVPVLAESRSAVEVVDIDRPLVFIIDYSQSDRMRLSAHVQVEGPPVSIFLIKGTASYNEWTNSEDVDIDDIKTGNASAGINTTFQVVINFSVMNVTDFDRELDIGDKDHYYLIIALHRYSGMPAKDVLLMTTLVDYDITWEFEDKYVPLWLLPVAILFFIAGTVMVVYYVWRTTVRVPEHGREGPAKRGTGGRGYQKSGPGPRQRPPFS